MSESRDFSVNLERIPSMRIIGMLRRRSCNFSRERSFPYAAPLRNIANSRTSSKAYMRFWRLRLESPRTALTARFARRSSVRSTSAARTYRKRSNALLSSLLSILQEMGFAPARHGPGISSSGASLAVTRCKQLGMSCQWQRSACRRFWSCPMRTLF